jgi:uncharacterized membrane protein (DUF441 family)
MDVLAEMFRSKKFIAMLVGLVTTLVAKFGWELDEATITQLVSLVAVYIAGQGLADFSKEATKAGLAE